MAPTGENKILKIKAESLRALDIPREVLGKIPEHIAREAKILPVKFDEQESLLTLVMINPRDQETIEEVKIATDSGRINVLTSDPEVIEELIELHYGRVDDFSLSDAEFQGFDEQRLKELLFICDDRVKNDLFRAFFSKSPVSISILKDPANIHGMLERIEFDFVVIDRSSFENAEAINKVIQEQLPHAQIKIIDTFLDLCAFRDNEGGIKSGFFFNMIDYLIHLLENEFELFRGHAHAVALYARQLAERCRLQAHEIEEITLAAYLDDFGEFLKRRNLESNEDNLLVEESDDEEKVIENLDKAVNFPYDIRTIFKYKHERFKGGGKHGLDGDDIPIGSQIVHLVGLFINEAKLMGKIQAKREAIQVIRDQFADHFDPRLIVLLEKIVLEELDEEGISTDSEQGRRVLVVDTKNLASSQMKLRLIHENIEVQVVHSVGLALSVFQQFEPTLIALGVDKISLLKKLKEEGRDIPRVVLLLPKNTPIDTSKYPGVVDQVSKPINLDLFVSKLKRLLGIEQGESGDGFFKENQEFYNLARKFKDKGQFEEAAKMYEKARDFKLAGSQYQELGQYERAARAYEAGKFFKIAAENYRKSGNYIKENEILTKLGEFYYAGKNLCEKHRFDQAISSLQQVERGTEHYLKSRMLLGKIFFAKKNYTAALTNFENSIDDQKLGKENLGNYYWLARCRESLGNNEEALKIFEAIYSEDVKYHDQEVKKFIAMLKVRIKENQEKEQKHAQDPLSSNKGGRYRKIEEIGRGGMGIVYMAEDTLLGRPVALKVLLAALKEDQKIIDNFFREARSAASLNHPNIITVYDVGIEDNNYFIAMEMISGETLREIIRKKKTPLSFKNMLGICKQILKGLGYAHSNKIIHRDLTTSNIMITDSGQVKIMDFGLARVVEKLMSEQSIIGGTPSFMSPEQVEGDPIDHRSDIYTFGVSMFEMVTAEVPFKKGDLGYHHLHTPPPSPRSINPEVPENLNSIILKCLQKKPEQRYQTVEDLQNDLNQLGKG